jgi:hypothetical protein
MSGGHFNYIQGRVADELYGWDLYIDYGEKGFQNSKEAAKRNPFEDMEMSELFFDALCVLHSLDYYLSGDNGKYQYENDLKYFKDKWFGKTEKERVEHIINIAIENATDDIKQTFGIT